MKKTLAALVLGISMSTAALADEGMYMAIDAGQSKFNDACKNVPATVDCKDTGKALRIAGGYNFARAWNIFTPGFEIGVADLGHASYTGGDFKAMALQIEGTGSLAVWSGLSVIAKLGIVQAHSKLDDGVQGFGTPGATSVRTNGAYAIGAQYDFNRDIGIRAQFENLRKFGDSTAAGEATVHVISAGLVYRP